MNSLDYVLFISLPENGSLNLGEIKLDSRKLLPIDAGAGPVEQWNISDLTWESLQSGIIKVIAWQPENPEIDYYKELLLQLRPNIHSEMVQMAMVKTQKRDYQLAEELLLALKNLNSQDSIPLLNLGVLYEARAKHYQQLGKTDESEEEFSKAHDSFQKSLLCPVIAPEAYYMAALFYFSRSEYEYSHSLLMSFLDKADAKDKSRDKAKKMAQEILKIKQGKDIYSQAFELIEKDENRKGIELVKQFLERSKDSWKGWFLLGWAYRKEKMWQEAYDAFLICHELNGENPDLLNELSLCAMELDKVDNALEYLDKGLNMAPQDIRILSNKAILMLKINRQEEAVELFLKILEISPEDKLAKDYLHFLGL